MKNFGTDLRDGEALSILLTQLDPTICQPCNEPLGSEARARHIIRNAKVRGSPFFFKYIFSSSFFVGEGEGESLHLLLRAWAHDVLSMVDG